MALLIGFLTPLLWPGMRYVYSESLLFMMVVIAGAILSGPIGVMILLGYVLGILIWGSKAKYGFFDYPVERGGSLLISYLLLALPAVIMPQLSRQMAEGVPLPLGWKAVIRNRLRTLYYAGACAMLVFLWCQAMIVLIRPVFTWIWDNPTVEAIEQVQVHWRWLVAVAAVAAVARLVMEAVVARRSPWAEVVANLQKERWKDPHRRGERRRQLPVPVRIGLASGAVTLLLAGTYTGWIDALVVAVAIAAFEVWRTGLIGSLPGAWVRLMLKVPAPIRFLAALLVGYPLAYLALKLLWWTDTFRPIFLGTLITLVIFYLFFPSQPVSLVHKGGRRKTT